MLTLTYRTRFCPRMFHDVPFVGCRCLDCARIRFLRRLRARLRPSRPSPVRRPDEAAHWFAAVIEHLEQAICAGEVLPAPGEREAIAELCRRHGVRTPFRLSVALRHRFAVWRRRFQ